jgi:hypothetical protein
MASMDQPMMAKVQSGVRAASDVGATTASAVVEEVAHV